MTRKNVSESVLKAAELKWGALPPQLQQALLEMCNELRLSITSGDVQLLDGRWYVTHSGLLRIARRHRCAGISVQPLRTLSDPSHNRWAFKATVYKSPTCRGFVGYGDADPSTVSPMVRGAEMRIAETRAVNRALRKAYGIGICSVEELGHQSARKLPQQLTNQESGNGKGEVRLRDRLLLLIRKYRLDADQVKCYAAHFCGTPALRDSSREQVQRLIDHLEGLAAEGRDSLVAQLTSAGEVPSRSGRTQQDQAEQSKEAA